MRATIERLATHYRVLLQNAVMQPDLRVSELPLLTTEEERQLLSVWNELQPITNSICVCIISSSDVLASRPLPSAPVTASAPAYEK